MSRKPSSQAGNRRAFLHLLAAAPLWAAAARRPAFAEAAPASIARLIKEARAVPAERASVSERMDFISRALLGIRYQANTLIGGPELPEQFVVRADAFDCVTFCEFVLAAALARDYSEFETALRTIRYERGKVVWAERNHYFAEWCRRAVENRICAPVRIPGTVTINKTVNWGIQGQRQVSIAAIPSANMLAHADVLANGDIIGFLSRRANLDFFHTGLVIFEDNGALMLRSAAQSRRRVLDEPMSGFLTANRVQHVALLRPLDGWRA